MKMFTSLPVNVQLEIRETLKAFDEVMVVYECGTYHVNTGVCLTKTYAPDHKVIGRYKAQDVFTKNERIINYVETFHSYPPGYKGKKNFGWLNSLTWNDKVKFDSNGDLISA